MRATVLLLLSLACSIAEGRPGGGQRYVSPSAHPPPAMNEAPPVYHPPPRPVYRPPSQPDSPSSEQSATTSIDDPAASGPVRAGTANAPPASSGPPVWGYLFYLLPVVLVGLLLWLRARNRPR